MPYWQNYSNGNLGMRMKQSEIQTQLEQVANSIATLPPAQWPGWIVYLLETLDGKASNAEYQAALEAIRNDITTRLNEGRW
jgi:hypothetical protein